MAKPYFDKLLQALREANVIDGVTYTPTEINEGIRKSISPYISHTYIAPGAELPITLVGGVPKKYVLPVTPKELNGFGVFDPGGANQALQLQVVNALNILFRLDASTSLVTTTNNVVIKLMLYKNGAPVAGSIIGRKIGTGADSGAMSLDATFRASENDLLDVYVESDLDTDLTFSLTSIFIEEV
jgi:hypothetical protein